MNTVLRDTLRRCVPAGLLAALLVASPAYAQQDRVVARLKQVNGSVLVSKESGLAAAGEAQTLTNGARVITTANSDAIVIFDNGCEVRMKANERFEVDSTKACALLVSQPYGTVAPVAAVGAPLAGFVLPLGAVGILADPRTRQSVSPN